MSVSELVFFVEDNYRTKGRTHAIPAICSSIMGLHPLIPRMISPKCDNISMCKLFMKIQKSQWYKCVYLGFPFSGIKIIRRYQRLQVYNPPQITWTLCSV